MLCAAFMHEPSLVFLDEPMSGLDPLIQVGLRKFFTDYVKAGGTIFMCTHNIDIASKLCSRIGIIKAGKLITVTRQKKNLESLFVRAVRE
jgi:ABC-2 type transport system ATP-binding protein